MPRLEAALTRADHIMLCLIFLAMPLSGYLNAAAAGHEVSWFGLFAIPPLVMRDDRLSQIAIAVHLAGQFLVYLFVFLHVAAALIHRVVRRDAVLQWMLPARRPRITATPPS
jgi:cytochrome b561